jgi:hypothetical protein
MEFLEAFRQGRRPQAEEFARRYPEQAERARALLPATSGPWLVRSALVSW